MYVCITENQSSVFPRNVLEAHKRLRRVSSRPREPDGYYLPLRGWARSGSIDWHPFFLNGRRTYASAAVVSRIGAGALPTRTTVRSGRRGKSHISALSRRRDATSRGPTFIGGRAPSFTTGTKRRASRKRNGRHVRGMAPR